MQTRSVILRPRARLSKNNLIKYKKVNKAKALASLSLNLKLNLRNYLDALKRPNKSIVVFLMVLKRASA